MSASEQIYALLVEANPVPDPDALAHPPATSAPGLHVLVPGRQEQDFAALLGAKHEDRVG